MKRMHLSRTLLSVLLAAAILLAAVPAGLAEETCNVSLDLNLRKNLMLAKYGLTVFLDDVQLAYLPQGGRLIRIVNLPKGIHTLHFYPEKGDGGVAEPMPQHPILYQRKWNSETVVQQ